MEIGKSVSDIFELPCDVVMNVPKIILLGENQAYVENYSALIEYKKELIRLKHKTGMIEICGSGFEITAIGEGNIVIKGKISGVKLI